MTEIIDIRPNVNDSKPQPISGVYAVITSDGSVTTSIENVKPSHIRPLQEALEAIIIKLHEFHNQAIVDDIRRRTGRVLKSIVLAFAICSVYSAIDDTPPDSDSESIFASR